MNTRVILLRHGQSTYNALGLYQGSSDRSVLTETGRQQARQTGQFLQQIPFDAVYTSTLKRARATAEEVLGSTDFTIDSRLTEADLPLWQGLPFQQVRSQFAADYCCWKQTPQKFKMELPDDREIYPALDLFDRVTKFWQEILPRHQNQTILIVAHGGTNRALISTALGISPALFHTIQQSNCGISILNFDAAKPGKARLEVLNVATQIGQKLPPLKEGGKGRRLLLVPSGTLHPTQKYKLARLLQGVAIDFSLDSDFDNSRAIADFILANHPETVRMQVAGQYFNPVWQHNLAAKNKNDRGLITGLLIASPAEIKNIFAEIFAIKLDSVNNFQLKPGTVSAIHYPNSDCPPLVQAIDILGLNSVSKNRDKTVVKAIA